MRGTLSLVPITNPVEGMSIIFNNRQYTLHHEDDEGSGHWKFGSPTVNVGMEPIYVLKQIVIEYEELDTSLENYDKPGLIFTKKTLPVSLEDWEYALQHIGEEVEFGWYDDDFFSHGINDPNKLIAKLIIPTTKTYTEEEAMIDQTVLAYQSGMLDHVKLLTNLSMWWEQHKKK